MSLFGRSKHSRLGVDIGASSIKIVELEKKGQGFELKTFGSLPLKQSIIRGAGSELEQSIAKVITDLATQVNVGTKNAVSSLPGFAVFTSIIDLPDLSEKDRAFAIQTEAAKYVPAPLEEVVLEWKELEDIDYGGGRIGKRILLIAAPRDYVDKFSHIFSGTSFNLEALEIGAFALSRSLAGNTPANVVIVDMGATTTDVSIVSAGSLFVNRTIDRGGSDLTNIIARSMKIDVVRAEDFKKDLNLTKVDNNTRAVLDALRPIIDSIIFEVQRVVNTFTGQYSRQVEKMILTGGVSLMNGLPDYAQAIMGMPVEVGNPWLRVSYPSGYEKILNDIAPSFATAVGLAMREA
jgi:type IV pilus assembly protein PilM